MSFATALPSSYAAASGDDRVRAALDAHYDALWCFLRRMGVAEGELDDAVQHVLLVFAQRAWRISTTAERSFLFGTAMRVAADFRRRRHHTLEVGDDALFQLAHPTPDAEHQLAEHELRRCLDRLLDELPAKFRAVFVLAEIEELTMAEIGELLGIPAGTVASRLRRARELFEAKALALKVHLETTLPQTEP
jgi:RNA polymerase sigma-70 factor (ECF subfamily)